MFQNRKSILIFGVGPLQSSIISRAKRMGLYTIGIDPAENAACKDEVDAFEVVGGQDFEGTMAVAKRYCIEGIVTAATDKPLVMMARIAKELRLPFCSVETAQWSTDKYQMKLRFLNGGVPCAKGRLVQTADEVNDFDFPVIVKPRDNSGSRGVKLCRDKEELRVAIEEALTFSHMETVLVEEFIEGKEYSIESLHHDGRNDIIQFTEKRTTPFPYNVELEHVQPAQLSEENKQQIREIITMIGKTLHFENCPSHTELKINDRGIFVIETSPRSGGDYIVSTLTPLSTGIYFEDEILRIALGKKIDPQPHTVRYAGIRYFSFQESTVIRRVPKADIVKHWSNVVDFSFALKVGDKVNCITSSLNRYGYLIMQADSFDVLEESFNNNEKIITEHCL